jgi:hypothetical protein
MIAYTVTLWTPQAKSHQNHLKRPFTPRKVFAAEATT